MTTTFGNTSSIHFLEYIQMPMNYDVEAGICCNGYCISPDRVLQIEVASPNNI
jgi:hypothetical protein